MSSKKRVVFEFDKPSQGLSLEQQMRQNIIDEKLIQLPDLLPRMDEKDKRIWELERALEFYGFPPNYVIPPNTGQSVGTWGSVVQQDKGWRARQALHRG